MGVQRVASSRVVLEAVLVVALVEATIMVMLDKLAPGLPPAQETLLDAVILSLVIGPYLLWRMRTQQLQVEQDTWRSLRGQWTWVTAFVMGLAMSWLMAWSFANTERQATEVRFDRAASQIETEIQTRFDRAYQSFHGLRSTMFMLGRTLKPQEYRDWMQTRFPSGDVLGMRGLGLIERIERADLQAWTEHTQSMGRPDFKVKTSGNAANLYVISRIEPIEKNGPALGFDVGQEAHRRAGIESAIDTGELTLTRRIVLVQDGKKRPGFLLYLPLYRPGASIASVADRRAALLGVVYAPIVFEEFMQGVGKDLEGMVNFGVFDDQAASDQSWLAGHSLKAEHERPTQALQRHFALKLGGQDLTLVIKATSEFETAYGRAWPIWAGVAGSVLSALIALTIWLLQSGRGRAEALAASRTSDLQEAKQEVEAALRAQSSVLRTLDQFSIYCVAAPDGTILDVNPMYCRISGYDRDELIGQNPRLLSSGVHDAVFWLDVWQTLLHGQPWVGEICNRAKSGQRYWVHTVIAPMLNARGEVEKYISFGYDVTEARAVQDEMAANAERFNLAIDGGSDGLWDWMNVHSQEIWWSPQFYRLLGYQPNEIPADLVTFDALLHPDYQQVTFMALEAALKNHENYDLEYPLRTKSGQYRWFRSRAKVYYDDFGAATRMAGSIQDIHDRKMAEATIREHSEQMAAIFSLSPDGFVSFDEHGVVAYASPAFDALMGQPNQWAIGLTEEAFSQRLFHSAVPGQIVQSLADVRQHSGRVVLEMKPPAKRMLEVRLSRGQGRAVSQVMAVRDVTHETEVDQMKSAFLSMAAHELRTPMASIYGFTELLLTRELKPEKQKDLLGRIYRQSEAMSGIINELLDLARIESRQGKDFTLGAHDLSSVVNTVVQDFKVPEGRAQPIVDAGMEDASIWVDRSKLQQAVLNVLSNAYKYSPQGGDVHIGFLSRMQEGRKQLGVRITDQGIGLTPEQLARVGERFYRADKSGNIPGTGLGVTIVKEILELMGGSMDITSEFGEGTQVTLWVPYFEARPVQAASTLMA